MKYRVSNQIVCLTENIPIRCIIVDMKHWVNRVSERISWKTQDEFVYFMAFKGASLCPAISILW